MAKKSSPEPAAAAPTAKRTPEEKAQRKADKAQRKASKTVTTGQAEKKTNQKQTLKAAAKQLQKELDNRMSEMVSRVRKETKAKLKEVVQEATQRLDVDTEKLFEQALQTLAKHYDNLAPGRTTDISIPAPKADKNGKTTEMVTNVATEDASTTSKRPSRPAAAPKKVAAKPTSSTSSRSKRSAGAPELNTPLGTANDSVAVDNA